MVVKNTGFKWQSDEVDAVDTLCVLSNSDQIWNP